MLDDYRAKKIDGDSYGRRFIDLLAGRRVEGVVGPASLMDASLL
jgi:hypothetical protein